MLPCSLSQPRSVPFPPAGAVGHHLKQTLGRVSTSGARRPSLPRPLLCLCFLFPTSLGASWGRSGSPFRYGLDDGRSCASRITLELSEGRGCASLAGPEVLQDYNLPIALQSPKPQSSNSFSLPTAPGGCFYASYSGELANLTS